MNIERITVARSIFVMNGGFDAISVKNKLAMALMNRNEQYDHFLQEPGLFKMLLMYKVVEIEREGNELDTDYIKMVREAYDRANKEANDKKAAEDIQQPSGCET